MAEGSRVHANNHPRLRRTQSHEWTQNPTLLFGMSTPPTFTPSCASRDPADPRPDSPPPDVPSLENPRLAQGKLHGIHSY
jgi:hypothetical protein